MSEDARRRSRSAPPLQGYEAEGARRSSARPCKGAERMGRRRAKVARPSPKRRARALAAIEAWRMRDGGSRGWQSRLTGPVPESRRRATVQHSPVDKPVETDVLERLRGADGRDAPTPAMAVTRPTPPSAQSRSGVSTWHWRFSGRNLVSVETPPGPGTRQRPGSIASRRQVRTHRQHDSEVAMQVRCSMRSIQAAIRQATANAARPPGDPHPCLIPARRHASAARGAVRPVPRWSSRRSGMLSGRRVAGQGARSQCSTSRLLRFASDGSSVRPRASAHAPMRGPWSVLPASRARRALRFGRSRSALTSEPTRTGRRSMTSRRCCADRQVDGRWARSGLREAPEAARTSRLSSASGSSTSPTTSGCTPSPRSTRVMRETPRETTPDTENRDLYPRNQVLRIESRSSRRRARHLRWYQPRHLGS